MYNVIFLFLTVSSSVLGAPTETTTSTSASSSASASGPLKVDLVSGQSVQSENAVAPHASLTISKVTHFSFLPIKGSLFSLFTIILTENFVNF